MTKPTKEEDWRSILNEQEAFDRSLETLHVWMMEHGDSGFISANPILSLELTDRIMRRIREEQEALIHHRLLVGTGFFVFGLVLLIGLTIGHLYPKLLLEESSTLLLGIFWMVSSLSACGVLVSLILLGYREREARQQGSWKEA